MTVKATYTDAEWFALWHSGRPPKTQYVGNYGDDVDLHVVAEIYEQEWEPVHIRLRHWDEKWDLDEALNDFPVIGWHDVVAMHWEPLFRSGKVAARETYAATLPVAPWGDGTVKERQHNRTAYLTVELPYNRETGNSDAAAADFSNILSAQFRYGGSDWTVEWEWGERRSRYYGRGLTSIAHDFDDARGVRKRIGNLTAPAYHRRGKFDEYVIPENAPDAPDAPDAANVPENAPDAA